MSGRPQTLLEKWLEDVPSSNNKSIKKERKELQDIFSSFGQTPPNFPLNTSQTIPLGIPQHGLQPQSHSYGSLPLPQVLKDNIKNEDENAIDVSSVKGIFGWEQVGDIPLPILLRKEEKLVPVRIVESKVIGRFSNVLPWTVFSCINIRSYYITENESKLLNEINTFHCDYYYGYDPFTVKDVVVCLSDVYTLNKFLETSKDVFTLSLGKSSIDWIGFVNISGSLVVPYIAKSSSASSATKENGERNDGKELKKYVPQSLIQQTVLLVKVEKRAMNEWDASYLRMLCIYAGLEHIRIQSKDSLCLLSDLKWDSSLCQLHIEECSPPVSTGGIKGIVGGGRVGSCTGNGSADGSRMGKPESHYGHGRDISEHHHGHSSNATNSRQFHHHHHHHQQQQQQQHRQAEINEQHWSQLLHANGGNSHHAIRSLHQITNVEVGGITLKAINLKPYSSTQAVFVSDIVTKMFRNLSILTAHYLLEKILQVKLYECTRLHEDSYVRAGVRPLQGDKLVAVDVLRKCLPQLKQIIVAGTSNPSRLLSTTLSSC